MERIFKCSFFRRSTVFCPVRNRMAQTALIAWDKMVARAAPRTPMPKPKIKTGSRMMLVTAPITTVSILILEIPGQR